MEDFDLIGPNGTDVNNEFLKAYRDSLKNQYDANVSSYKQQKRNADAQIMSAANKAGMMYSNFPQRSKIQTEADYLTGLSKLRGTYQTGLDKLRNNAVDAYNQIKAYEEAISDLSGSGGGSGGSGGVTGGGTGGDGTTGTPGKADGNNPSNTIQGNYDLVEHIPASDNVNTSSNNNTFWQDVANAHSVGRDQSVQRKAGAAAGRMAGSYIGSFFGPLGGLIGRGLGGKIGDEWADKYGK